MLWKLSVQPLRIRIRLHDKCTSISNKKRKHINNNFVRVLAFCAQFFFCRLLSLYMLHIWCPLGIRHSACLCDYISYYINVLEQCRDVWPRLRNCLSNLNPIDFIFPFVLFIFRFLFVLKLLSPLFIFRFCSKFNTNAEFRRSRLRWFLLYALRFGLVADWWGRRGGGAYYFIVCKICSVPCVASSLRFECIRTLKKCVMLCSTFNLFIVLSRYGCTTLFFSYVLCTCVRSRTRTSLLVSRCFCSFLLHFILLLSCLKDEIDV